MYIYIVNNYTHYYGMGNRLGGSGKSLILIKKILHIPSKYIGVHVAYFNKPMLYDETYVVKNHMISERVAL